MLANLSVFKTSKKNCILSKSNFLFRRSSLGDIKNQMSKCIRNGRVIHVSVIVVLELKSMQRRPGRSRQRGVRLLEEIN